MASARTERSNIPGALTLIRCISSVASVLVVADREEEKEKGIVGWQQLDKKIIGGMC